MSTSSSTGTEGWYVLAEAAPYSGACCATAVVDCRSAAKTVYCWGYWASAALNEMDCFVLGCPAA